MKKLVTTVAIVLGIIMVLAVVGGFYYKKNYPFGASHCCIVQMMGALEQFASEHDGRYPTGESSPEASLSLLCRSNYTDAYIIRGMTVPENAVRKVFEKGELLGPDTCGWHYTEGLTLADDPRIALLYCKQPLGHNGERTKDGGRQVVLVGGIEWISGSQWPSFLQNQKELLSKRNDREKSGGPLVSVSIQLSDGREIESVQGDFTIQDKTAGPNSSGSGTQSGGNLNRESLVWFRAPMENGSNTRILSFSNLVSDPVTVVFVGGIPDKTNVVFKMKAK